MWRVARGRWWLLCTVGLALAGAAIWILAADREASSTPAKRAPVASATLARSVARRGAPLRIVIDAATKSISVGVTHEWSVSVFDAKGAPVAGCNVGFDGSMPEHGHGLPTTPRVTEAQTAGRYRVEGVRFSMGGYWRLDLSANCGPSLQTAAFDLRL